MELSNIYETVFNKHKEVYEDYGVASSFTIAIKYQDKLLQDSLDPSLKGHKKLKIHLEIILKGLEEPKSEVWRGESRASNMKDKGIRNYLIEVQKAYNEARSLCNYTNDFIDEMNGVPIRKSKETNWRANMEKLLEESIANSYSR